MFYVTILILSAIAIFSFYLYRNVFRPVTFFCTEWVMILMFYKMNKSFFDVSGKTYLIILIGIISFVVGCMGVDIYWKQKSRTGNSNLLIINGERDIAYNRTLVYIMLIIAMFYCVWKVRQMGIDNIFEKGAFGKIRTRWLMDGGITNAKEDFIYNIIILPFVYLNILVFINNYIISKIEKKQAIGTVMCIGMIVLFSGARMMIMDFVLMLVIAQTIARKDIALKKREKIIIIVSFAVIWVIVNKICIDRQGNTAIQVLTNNFALSVPLMDQVVKLADAGKDITYGLIFFRGIIDIPLTLLAVFGIDLWPKAYGILSGYTNPFYSIGTGEVANAYITSFFYFYLDARWVGVIFFSIIFGFFSQYLYKKMVCGGENSKGQQKSRILYLFLMTIILRTFFNYSFSKLSYIVILALIYLVFIKIKIVGR